MMSSKFKQTTIFTAFQNWKSLEKEKTKKRLAKYEYEMKILNVPGLIDLTQLDTDSDSDTEIQRVDPSIIVKSELAQVPVSTICVNKPNAFSTPLGSHNFPESDSESSDSTMILEDSMNSKNTSPGYTRERVIVKQNILLKPVDGIKNNRHVPEGTKTVVNGQVVCENTAQKGNLHKSTSDVSNSEKSREAHKVSSPNKEIPVKIPSKESSNPHDIQKLKITNLSEGTSMTSIASGKNSKLQTQNKHDQETGNSKKPSQLTDTSNAKKKSDFTLCKEKLEKNIKQTKSISSYLTVINNLFETIFVSPHLKTLIEAEKPVLNMMATANPKYFFVCLKLCTWLPKWYNIFDFCEKIMVGLEEKEIIDLHKFLKYNKMVDIDIYKGDLPTLLRDLGKADLMSICKKFKISKAMSSKVVMKKDDLIQSLLKYCNTQCTLLKKSAKDLILEEVKSKMGYCVKVNAGFRQAFYNAYILGTFTNPAFSDIKEFFNDMLNRKIAFPDYEVEDYMVFYSKEEFNSYVDARRVRDSIEDFIKSKNHLEMLQASRTALQSLKNLKRNNEDQDRYKDVPHLKRFTAESVYISCLSSLAEPLKAKFPDEVRKWLEYLINNFPASHRVGDWYNQLTWLYIRYLKQDDYEHTAKLIIEFLKSNNGNVSDVQMYQIRKRAEQLKKGKQREIIQLDHDIITDLLPPPIKLEDFPSTIIDATAIRSNDQGRKRKYVVHEDNGNKSYMTVENIALEYYTERCGYTGGRHCEGSLMTALFALLFWDITYHPDKVIPGTFLSKIQNVPLDMYSKQFYANRKEAIDRRLEQIESEWTEEELLGFLRRTWEEHSHGRGICEPGLALGEPELLGMLVRCVGGKVVAKILGRMVGDLRLYRSGMPDLLVWDVENRKSKFVEVKGENDKLSIKQQLWLKYLMSIGADVEVCNVYSIGSKRMKRKSSEVDEKQAKPEKKNTGKKTDADKDKKVEKKNKKSDEKADKRKTDEKTDAVDGKKKAKIDKGKRKANETKAKGKKPSSSSNPGEKNPIASRNLDDSGIFNEDSD